MKLLVFFGSVKCEKKTKSCFENNTITKEEYSIMNPEEKDPARFYYNFKVLQNKDVYFSFKTLQ